MIQPYGQVVLMLVVWSRNLVTVKRMSCMLWERAVQPGLLAPGGPGTRAGIKLSRFVRVPGITMGSARRAVPLR